MHLDPSAPYFVLDRRLPVTREVQDALDAYKDATETDDVWSTGGAAEAEAEAASASAEEAAAAAAAPARASRVVGAWHKAPSHPAGAWHKAPSHAGRVLYRVLRGEEDAWIDSGSLSAEETRLAEQFEASLWPSAEAMRKWQRRGGLS